jgi:hypothetical protein
MKKGFSSFNIVFQGIEYIVDVLKQGKDTTVFVEYAEIEEDVEEDVLSKLTNYLIGEGFVEYNED